AAGATVATDDHGPGVVYDAVFPLICRAALLAIHDRGGDPALAAGAAARHRGHRAAEPARAANAVDDGNDTHRAAVWTISGRLSGGGVWDVDSILDPCHGHDPCD